MKFNYPLHILLDVKKNFNWRNLYSTTFKKQELITLLYNPTISTKTSLQDNKLTWTFKSFIFNSKFNVNSSINSKPTSLFQKKNNVLSILITLPKFDNKSSNNLPTNNPLKLSDNETLSKVKLNNEDSQLTSTHLQFNTFRKPSSTLNFFNTKLMNMNFFEKSKIRINQNDSFITTSTLQLFDINYLKRERLYTKLKYSRSPAYDIVSGGAAAFFASFIGFLISEKFGIELVDSGDFYIAFMYGIFIALSLKPFMRIIQTSQVFYTTFLLRLKLIFIRFFFL